MAAVATDMGVSGGVGGGAIDVDAGGKGCRCLTGGRARCLHRWVVNVVNHITYVLCTSIWKAEAARNVKKKVANILDRFRAQGTRRVSKTS